MGPEEAHPTPDPPMADAAPPIGADGTTDVAETALLEAPEFSPLPPDAPTDITSVEPNTKEPQWNPDQYAAFIQAKIAFRLIWVLAGVLLGGAALLSTSKWTGLASKDVTSAVTFK